MKRAVILLSGGLDSATTLAIAKHEGYEIFPLSFEYGQRHRVEIDSAKQIVQSLGVREHRIVKIDLRVFGGSALTDTIEVSAQHSGGIDRFVLDRDFPFLLREWQMADGSKLKLKRGLKADYWNYSKEGDRERALKNPMLQHPD